jgi:acylphosphatase
MKRHCYRCSVSGRVQGVFFRASTRRMALALGLTGYARNLPDGRVEVVMCGKPEALAQMRDWLWVGPDAARVSDVACESLSGADYDGFTMG